MKNPKVIIIFLIIALVLGGILYLIYPTPEEYRIKKPEPVMCTMEAKQCPDGSFVSRHGPKCEFSPCPIPKGMRMEDGTVPQ